MAKTMLNLLPVVNKKEWDTHTSKKTTACSTPDYEKPHQRDVMKLRLNTGFEGVARFVILRLIRHLAVEARHCVRRFARHFIKI
jgi:hypothetical protein